MKFILAPFIQSMILIATALLLTCCGSTESGSPE